MGSSRPEQYACRRTGGTIPLIIRNIVPLEFATTGLFNGGTSRGCNPRQGEIHGHHATHRRTCQGSSALFVRRKIRRDQVPERQPVYPAPWPDFRQILKWRADFVWGQEHCLVRLPHLERPTQGRSAASRRGLKLVDHPEHTVYPQSFSRDNPAQQSVAREQDARIDLAVTRQRQSFAQSPRRHPFTTSAWNRALAQSRFGKIESSLFERSATLSYISRKPKTGVPPPPQSQRGCQAGLIKFVLVAPFCGRFTELFRPPRNLFTRKYESGRPATPVAARRSHKSVLPLRGVEPVCVLRSIRSQHREDPYWPPSTGPVCMLVH